MKFNLCPKLDPQGVIYRKEILMMIWMLFICGMIIFLYALFNYYIGWSSKHWSSTSGRVLSAVVQERKNKNQSAYHPSVIYEYIVDSQKYKRKRLGNYIAFGNNKGKAENIIKPFSSGQDVKVYYHPWIPSLSALIPGAHQTGIHITFIIIGGLIALQCGIVLFTDNPYLASFRTSLTLFVSRHRLHII